MALKHHITTKDNSGIKHQNTLGCLDQYTASNSKKTLKVSASQHSAVGTWNKAATMWPDTAHTEHRDRKTLGSMKWSRQMKLSQGYYVFTLVVVNLLEWVTSYGTDKLVIDRRTHTQANAGNDNTFRLKLAFGKNQGSVIHSIKAEKNPNFVKHH